MKKKTVRMILVDRKGNHLIDNTYHGENYENVTAFYKDCKKGGYNPLMYDYKVICQGGLTARFARENVSRETLTYHIMKG